MKNKNFVLIPALATFLVSLSACSDEQRAPKVCVDRKSNMRVDDALCSRPASGGIFPAYYGWYYMPYNSYVPGVGTSMSTAKGGSFEPSRSVSYSPAVARGGFGSSAVAFGGGAGE